VIVRKFKKEDLSQVLELCREVRQYHIDILGGYFVKPQFTLTAYASFISQHIRFTLPNPL